MYAFERGDTVEAHTHAQGLRVGRLYDVVQLFTLSTLFGTYVTYEVKDQQSGEVFKVRNMHVLARRVG